MTASYSSRNDLIVIGENIHASRVVLRKGKQCVIHDDREFIKFTTVSGENLLLEIPEWIKSGQDYKEGRVKHIKLAVRTAMAGGKNTKTALAYLEQIASHQERHRAAFLDINIDEMTYVKEQQKELMAWLVPVIQLTTSLPMSIDSSDIDLLEVGLQLCDRSRARPLLNSASLERIEALDIANTYDARVVVTASGASAMPRGVEERLSNASAIVEVAFAKGIPPGDLFIDPLIYPIAVDTDYARETLDTIHLLRERFGPEIHITGGISNVSFGIPGRRIINEIFLELAIEAGADSAIIDPTIIRPTDLPTADSESPLYRLAKDALMGRDAFCKNYLRAWRSERNKSTR